MIQRFYQSFLFSIVILFACLLNGVLYGQKAINASGSKSIYDPATLLNETETKALISVIKEASKKLPNNVKVAVYKTTDSSFYNSDEASLLIEHKVYSSADRPILFLIDKKNNRGRLLLNGSVKNLISKEEQLNIEIQLLNKVIESGGIVEAVRLSTNELHTLRQRKINEVIAQNKTIITDDTKRWSFWLVVWFLAITSILYVLLYLNKSTRKMGKEYENMEFYSLSGFFKTEKLATYAGVFILFMVIFYFTVFYYGDILILAVLSVVAIVPLSNLTVFVGRLSKVVLMRQENSSRPLKLSLLERKLLIKPDVTGFDLIKINFAQLLLSKKIAVEIEYRDMPDGRSRAYYIIMKGEHFATNSISSKDLPFLDSLRDLDMGAGYYLHDYARQVNSRISGLKAYKRNSVAKSLVEKALLSKWNWGINIFKPTPSSAKVITDIKKERETLQNQLMSLKPDDLTKIPLNMDFLLFDNFQSILHQLAEINNDQLMATWADAISIFDEILDKEKWDESKVAVESEY